MAEVQRWKGPEEVLRRCSGGESAEEVHVERRCREGADEVHRMSRGEVVRRRRGEEEEVKRRRSEDEQVFEDGELQGACGGAEVHLVHQHAEEVHTIGAEVQRGRGAEVQRCRGVEVAEMEEVAEVKR